MRRRETPLPDTTIRELAAIDAALVGGPVAPDLDELAELARLIAEQRPAPTPAYAAALDERAAAGFPRSGTAPSRRRRMLLPALGATAALAVAGAAVLTTVGGDAPNRISGAPPSGNGGEAAVKTAPPAAVGGAFDQMAPSAAPSAALAAPVRRSVERGAALRLGTPASRVDEVAAGVIRVTDGVGGYVLTSSIATGGGGRGGASFDLRIPSSRLQPALAQLSRLARVRSRTQNALDITSEVASNRERIVGLRAARRGVLRQLAAASSLAETTRLQGVLRRLDARLAAARAARRALRQRTALSSVSVEVVSERRPHASGGTWTLGDALHDGLRILTVGLGIAVVALAVLLPLALLGALAALLGRGLRSQRRDRALDAV